VGIEYDEVVCYFVTVVKEWVVMLLNRNINKCGVVEQLLGSGTEGEREERVKIDEYE
jgi:hypothetical protein